LHRLPAPVLLQRGLVPADDAPPAGDAERAVDSASAFRKNHAITNRTVAQLFGDLIASGNDSAASSLLSKEMQSSTSPEAITAAVASMTAYASSQI